MSMDNHAPTAFCLFYYNFDFISCLQFCQTFNLDVHDFVFHGFDALTFFDDLDFAIFLGFISNFDQNTLLWAFLNEVG